MIADLGNLDRSSGTDHGNLDRSKKEQKRAIATNNTKHIIQFMCMYACVHVCAITKALFTFSSRCRKSTR